MKNRSNYLVMLLVVRRFLVLALMNIVCGVTIVACPTCIGTIEYNSPKFFSNDAYQMKHDTQETQVAHVNASTILEKEE